MAEMIGLRKHMGWRRDRLYSCSNPCFKAETPIGTAYWYKDGGLSYAYSMYIVPKNGEQAIQVQSNHSDYERISKDFAGPDQFVWHSVPGLVLPKNLEYRRLGVFRFPS